ncbi:putative DNA repair protein [Piscirickettsia salmonis]|uniref:DNA repair family protein n=1 Tax=Piscirickettsia salmonis TaxID=1238 RepID=A0A1L6TCT5_PISSA|nr:PD-(D/E)XK nuclease family protein [Piscirickettsia salmonis]AKP74283.1 DNA repair protein [Piscirickettsia salmonis LF-89 = ATCC VR-1361]ALB23195.1 DNA repair family protein [Piscirickettsia salmonis]ALY03121.1 DNA repair protein [Piscirickettsia salmonis]AMA42680.1 DNA repair protein [Piscirickettsia salmonis]AOS35152.1 DNA repair protein [Piscirickettsia salmonis]
MKAIDLLVLDLLKQDSLIITPNLRLQDRLRFISQEQAVVEEPAIYAWSSWCDLLWNELEILSLSEKAELPLVLNHVQECALWEKVISDTEEDVSKTSTLVNLAISANQRLCEWQIAPEDIQNYPMQYDAERFLAWQCRFKQQLQANHWQLRCERWQLLKEAVKHGQLIINYNAIVFIGFDTFTPQQSAWVVQLLELGIAPYSLFDHQGGQLQQSVGPQRVMVETPEEEFYAAAEWAEQIARQHPEGSIGIVIPDLTEQRACIERVFNDVFTPLKHLPGSPYALQKVSISGGYRLDGQPLVQVVLDVLMLFSGQPVEIALWQRVLQSPFLVAAESEQALRLAVLSRLIEQNQATVSVKYLLTLLADYEGNQLSVGLKAASRLMKQHYQKRYPTEQWASLISDLLLMMGWPGERVLNSAEYQIAAKLWPEVLDECSSLSGFFKPLTYLEMIARLKQSLYTKVTQTRSDLTSIYVLGLLEASGQRFDALWVTGLYDGLWPQPVSLHPLLPARLQIDYDMPHSSPERELQLAERLFKRLTVSADQVIISTPKFMGELELRPSAFVQNVPKIKISQLLTHSALSFRESLLGAPLEPFTDDQGSALVHGSEISGGTQVIRSQLACPFQAYGMFRLNARAPEPAREGLLLAEQGTLLHAVLDRVWQRLQNSVELQQLSSEACRLLVAEVVAGVISSWQKKLKGVSQTQWQLEGIRLTELVFDWLNMEKMRELPFHVVGIETRRSLFLAGFSFQLRIDRVDETSVGILLWDYKSSDSANMTQWFYTPMQEPQLPLYALTQVQAQTKEVAGFGFAKVLAEGGKFNVLVSQQELDIGLNKKEHRIKALSEFKDSVTESWSEQMTHWQTILEKAAADFGEGKAGVFPSEQACQYCELKPLCRIQERYE